MDTHTRRHRLPDQGFAVVRWAHDLEAGRGAVVVEPDVERIRHPDGALTYADTEGYRTVADGPLSVLRELLDLEARELRRWSKAGFARFHKRAAAKNAERICRRAGSDAAVDWALSAATRQKLSLRELRERLSSPLYTRRGRNEDYYRLQIRQCIDERRRRRLSRR